MRADLLALDDADLADIANRGLVKRARRELDRGEPSCELIEEVDGRLEARWSDGVTCQIPADAALTEATCSSSGLGGGISRSLIRTVLLYQRRMAEQIVDGDGEEKGAESVSPSVIVEREPWDPGAISDQALASLFSPRVLNRERRLCQAEEAVELVRSPKPTARFFLKPCFVRFSVPGDIRYARCSCRQEPCPSVARAVWAFRELPVELEGGLVTRGDGSSSIRDELLEELEGCSEELWRLGLGGVRSPFLRALDRLAARARSEGLIWPAEIVKDLEHEVARYMRGDGRFDPAAPPRLVAELDVRVSALRAGSLGIPEIFIRGSELDRESRLERGLLHGLGCEVKALDHTGACDLIVYCQLAQSGDVVALTRRFVDGEDPKDFPTLAATSIRRGISLRDLAGGRTAALGLTLSAGRELRLGRRDLESHPPAWREIRDPVRAEGFDEIASRLAKRPPKALAPRRAGEDLFVCEVAGVEEVEFSVSEQSTIASLRDRAGRILRLVHPFSNRGRSGHERLLGWLRAGRVEAVGGRFSQNHGALEVRPSTLWNDKEVLLPWIDGDASALISANPESANTESANPGSTKPESDAPESDAPDSDAPDSADPDSDAPMDPGSETRSDEQDPEDATADRVLETSLRKPMHAELRALTASSLADLCRLGFSQAAATERSGWQDLECRWGDLGSRFFLSHVRSIRSALDGLAEGLSAEPAAGLKAARRLAVLLEMAGHGDLPYDDLPHGDLPHGDLPKG